jgi:long-chain acyl-CoA synthetase
VAGDTIPARLLRNAEQYTSSPAYAEKVDGRYETVSWSGYADRVVKAGKALVALGLEPGQHPAILGFNRPEWVILDLAGMAVGGAPIGIYATSSPREIHYIARHAEVPLILVENQEQLDKVLSVKDDLPHLRSIVVMRGTAGAPGVLTWEEFLAKGEGIPDAEISDRIEALEPDDVASLIYTSGTTGSPKGVMLTHHNLTWTADRAGVIFVLSPDDRLVSYLPLSHIAEQMFTIHGSITFGYSVWFAESIAALPENLKEVRPTIFFAVPRVWEKFEAAVKAELAEAGSLKARLAAWAMGVGRQVIELRNHGKKPTGLLKLRWALADRLVLSKVRTALGLDQAHITLVAAAPVDAEVLRFFSGFGLQVLEVYGQTEGSGPTTFSRPGNARFGRVGPPFPETEVKIAADGEILLRGGNVFAGYYKDAEATERALIDGWLHSGDLGELDDEGFLSITGRKKDIIITAGGHNVAPKILESGIKQNPLVSEVVVIGDRRKYLTALVSLDVDAAAGFVAKRGISGPAHESAEVYAAVEHSVNEVNELVARAEQIKKFTILPRDLTIETGEITGTLKVRRDVVARHFSAEIEAMYL